MADAQAVIDVLKAQRERAMDQLVEAAIVVKEKDEEIARLKALLFEASQGAPTS